MTTNSCRNCGQPLVPGAAFCGGCGNAVATSEDVSRLGEALAELVAERGEGVFADADGFRAALDDHLPESTASAGTIYLLTEAVRLGALDSLRDMIAAGGPPEGAVASVGARVARDRGSNDPAKATWATAIIGYAAGLVPAALLERYAAPPAPSANPADLPPPPAPIAPAPPPPVASAPPTIAAPRAAPPPPPLPPLPLQQQHSPFPVVVPTAPPPPAQGSGVGRIVLVGVLALLVMLGVGSATAYLLTRGDDTPSGSSDRSTTADRPTASGVTPPTDPGTATVTVTEDASTDAVTVTPVDDPEAVLRNAIAADRTAVAGLEYFWVPQLASLSGEINGSWSAALTEYENLLATYPDALILDAEEWPHSFIRSTTFDTVFVVVSATPASPYSAPILSWCEANRGDRSASCYAKLIETRGSPRNNADQDDPEPEFN